MLTAHEGSSDAAFQVTTIVTITIISINIVHIILLNLSDHDYAGAQQSTAETLLDEDMGAGKCSKITTLIMNYMFINGLAKKQKLSKPLLGRTWRDD